MLQLRENRLYLTLLGALFVMSGMIMRNTSEQLNTSNSVLSKNLAPISFLIGWLIVAYSLALPGNAKGYLHMIKLDIHTVQTMIAVASIVISVYMMKTLTAAGLIVPMIYPTMYAGGWLLLGYTVGGVLGLLSAVSVLVAVMGVLPWQRQKCVVDGPGMVLYGAAWFLLAAGNAL